MTPDDLAEYKRRYALWVAHHAQATGHTRWNIDLDGAT